MLRFSAITQVPPSVPTPPSCRPLKRCFIGFPPAVFPGGLPWLRLPIFAQFFKNSAPGHGRGRDHGRGRSRDHSRGLLCCAFTYRWGCGCGNATDRAQYCFIVGRPARSFSATELGVVANTFFRRLSGPYCRELFLMLRNCRRVVHVPRRRRTSASARPQRQRSYEPILVDYGNSDLRLLDTHALLKPGALKVVATELKNNKIDVRHAYVTSSSRGETPPG